MRKSLVVISLLTAIFIFSVGAGLIINTAFDVPMLGGITSFIISFYLTSRLSNLLNERNNAKN
jgi:hypothetical protein